MKNPLKAIIALLGVAIVSTLIFTSCSKDTDPADKDFFVGKYSGHISYVDNNADDQTKIDKENGTVEVVKVGGNYNFIFSDGIPNITGVKFNKEGEHTVINVGSDESHLIKIDEDNLIIAYTKDNKVWTANCNR